MAKLYDSKKTKNSLALRLFVTPYFLMIIIMALNALPVRSNVLPPLTIVTEHLVPFQIQHQNGNLSGFSIDVVKALFQSITHEPKIQVMPWARAYKMAVNEPNTLIFSIARAQYREAMFHWIGCIIDENFFFWGLKNNYQNNHYNIEQLKHQKIAVSRYSNAEQYVLDNQFSNISRLIQEEQNIQMLFSNRVNLIVATDLTIKHRTKRLGLNYHALVKVHNATELNNQLCIALSLDSDPKWILRLQNAFLQLESNGTIDAIRQKWLANE
jgi:polar amino acid transport system substrate-binding protein